MKIIFIRSHYINGTKQVVGQKAHVRDEKGRELIRDGKAQQYFGPMNKKIKFKLENLR